MILSLSNLITKILQRLGKIIPKHSEILYPLHNSPTMLNHNIDIPSWEMTLHLKIPFFLFICSKLRETKTIVYVHSITFVCYNLHFIQLEQL